MASKSLAFGSLPAFPRFGLGVQDLACWDLLTLASRGLGRARA